MPSEMTEEKRATFLRDVSSIVLEDNENGTFTCSHCGQTFSNKIKAVHRGWHQIIVCEIDGQEIYGTMGLAGHKKIHDDWMPKIAQELEQLIQREPGLHPREYENILRVKRHSLTSQAKRLEKMGKIVRTGQRSAVRWHPKERPAAKSAIVVETPKAPAMEQSPIPAAQNSQTHMEPCNLIFTGNQILAVKDDGVFLVQGLVPIG